MSEWKEAEFGFIPYDWQAIRFKEILKIPLRNGVNKPSRIRGNGDYKMVNMNEIFAHDVIVDIPMEFVDLSRKEKETSLLEKHDLLFARQSLVFEGAGKCSIYLGDNEKVCFEGHLIRARLNKQKANPEFYYYFFSSSYGKRFLRTIVEQAVVAGIRGSDLNELEIPYAPKTQQDGAVKLLSCLDRKIENLRRQNETLEKIAETLFKHWFVDFEFPNADGQPYKSSGGEMVPSELGDIPAGWRVGKLRELVQVNPKETIRQDSSVKYVDMKSLSTSSMEIIGYIIREFTSGSKFRNGDTLLARITPCLENGKTAFVNILNEGEVAYGSTEFIVMRAKDSCCPEYVYCLSRSEYFRDYAIKNMTGSSGRQRVPNDQVEDYELAIPEHRVVQLFHAVCKSLFLKIKFNQQQIQTLTQARDTLLPKLISGQLRINE